jgi:hypothetical protein
MAEIRCRANAVGISFWRGICDWRWSALAAWDGTLYYRMLIKKNRDLITFRAVRSVPTFERP